MSQMQQLTKNLAWFHQSFASKPCSTGKHAFVEQVYMLRLNQLHIGQFYFTAMSQQNSGGAFEQTALQETTTSKGSWVTGCASAGMALDPPSLLISQLAPLCVFCLI